MILHIHIESFVVYSVSLSLADSAYKCQPGGTLWTTESSVFLSPSLSLSLSLSIYLSLSLSIPLVSHKNTHTHTHTHPHIDTHTRARELGSWSWVDCDNSIFSFVIGSALGILLYFLSVRMWVCLCVFLASVCVRLSVLSLNLSLSLPSLSQSVLWRSIRVRARAWLG